MTHDGRTNFDVWALSLAGLVAERSTCPRRKTGAVAVDQYNRVISIGYNGQPRGFHRNPSFEHCIVNPCPGASDESGDTERCEAIHAETNVVLNCSDSFSITTIYLTDSPCFRCALVLANLPNLTRVVYGREYTDARGIAVLMKAGIAADWVVNSK